MKFQHKILATFVFGLLFGKFVKFNTNAQSSIELLLFFMLFLIGIEGGYSISLREIKGGLEKGFATLTCSILGSIVAGIAFYPIMGKVSLASAIGLGWYSFSGSFLTSQLGGQAGFIGFITNLSRELFGMIAIPTFSKKLDCGSLISLAGSPSSDTLFPFIYKECGSSYIIPSIAQGLMTAFAVPLLTAAFV
ncbi:MAG: lysine exporter LysO family protein [Thermoprotei archaeon]|nr:lysine exporter LysO family protein [Thermoprotei archaeon]